MFLLDVANKGLKRIFLLLFGKKNSVVALLDSWMGIRSQNGQNVVPLNNCLCNIFNMSAAA